jgi:hypothetical protein
MHIKKVIIDEAFDLMDADDASSAQCQALLDGEEVELAGRTYKRTELTAGIIEVRTH